MLRQSSNDGKTINKTSFPDNRTASHNGMTRNDCFPADFDIVLDYGIGSNMDIVAKGNIFANHR
jgi:hypothetical protein